jgi:hypothetical protein
MINGSAELMRQVWNMLKNGMGFFSMEEFMPQAFTHKREHELKKLEHRFKQEERYKGREDEVAARIVNKQRARYGETKMAKEKSREGKSPDRGLPIDGFEHLTIAQIRPRLDSLSKKDIEKIRSYETRHKNRKGLLAALESRLAEGK